MYIINIGIYWQPNTLPCTEFSLHKLVVPPQQQFCLHMLHVVLVDITVATTSTVPLVHSIC